MNEIPEGKETVFHNMKCSLPILVGVIRSYLVHQILTVFHKCISAILYSIIHPKIRYRYYWRSAELITNKKLITQILF